MAAIVPVEQYDLTKTCESDTSEGRLKYSISAQGIFIERVCSRSIGFGTACYRLLFEVSMQRQIDGRIEAEAIFKSHLFHLYMGMEPIEYEIPAFAHFLGGLRRSSPESMLSEVIESLKKGVHLSSHQESVVACCKTVLAITEGKVDDAKIQQISDTDVIDGKEQILKKTVPAFWYGRLTVVLMSDLAKKPNTSSLQSVFMAMSELGKKRWKNTIENKVPFEPFRSLEHLYPKLYRWQREELSFIMGRRMELLPLL